MTQFIAEQMRSLLRRLEESPNTAMAASGELEGSLNPKQLAELLGIDNMQTFARSIAKIRRGDADQLTRAEMTEMATAFVNLLAAEAEETQKAMMAIKRVSAKHPPASTM